MSRIACIFVPDFPLAALARLDPGLQDAPCAVVDKHSPLAQLCALSRRARTLGARHGMTVAQAQALVPGLIVLQRSPDAERSCASALLEVAYSFSPAVEDDAGGRVWLDVGGLERLRGPEEETARELMRRVERIGLRACVGIASGKNVAYLAARCGGLRVIAPGMEREFLDWLPIDMLELEEELEVTLRRWGIRRLGELANLDVRAIGSRIGARGVELVKLARGEESSPLIPRPQERVFEDKVELEYPVESLEPLNFVMRAMVERVVDRLELHGLVAGDMTLELALSDRRRDVRQVAVAASTNDTRSLLALLMLSLERNPPPMAVEAVRIAIEPRSPRPLQSDMFAPSIPAPMQMEVMLARLAALCGPEGVGALVPVNSHRPEAFERRQFAPSQAGLPPQRPRLHAAAQLVVRAIRPTEEIEVMCARDIPEFVRGRSVCGRVISVAGPWRRHGEWWRRYFSSKPTKSQPTASSGLEAPSTDRDSTPLARDYYDLALDDGGVYRVFYDLHLARWFLDGVYD